MQCTKNARLDAQAGGLALDVRAALSLHELCPFVALQACSHYVQDSGPWACTYPREYWSNVSSSMSACLASRSPGCCWPCGAPMAAGTKPQYPAHMHFWKDRPCCAALRSIQSTELKAEGCDGWSGWPRPVKLMARQLLKASGKRHAQPERCSSQVASRCKRPQEMQYATHRASCVKC